MNTIEFTTKDLPSNGLFYDKLYNIKLKSLTVGNYKDLMRCSNQYFKQNILNVLDNIVESDGLSVYDMVYGDVIAILMWYKCNSSIDTNLIFSTNCVECGNKVEFNVNLGDFEVDSLEAFGSIKVGLPSGNFLDMSPKTFMEYEHSTDVIGHICNVFKYLTPYDIDKMDLEDFLYLKDYVENFKIGFSYKNNISCRFCKHIYDVKVNAMVNHIFSHVDYSKIMSNIFHIAKYTNYKFENYEDLFDYETSIQVVNDMMETEQKEYESLTKKRQ